MKIFQIIYYDRLGKVMKRFSISKCNNWILSKSDMVIPCVTKSFGGACNFTQKAIKQEKTIINIYILAIKNEITGKYYKEKQM